VPDFYHAGEHLHKPVAALFPGSAVQSRYAGDLREGKAEHLIARAEKPATEVSREEVESRLQDHRR
jgi:hypothetical protein